MYCQGCAWTYAQLESSANVTVCPKCFGSWFGSQPPQPIAPLDSTTPNDRSRAALPANIRKTLEESNLPVEVATAIADLCESRQRPEAEAIRWMVALQTDRGYLIEGYPYMSRESAQKDVDLIAARGERAEVWECYRREPQTGVIPNER